MNPSLLLAFTILQGPPTTEDERATLLDRAERSVAEAAPRAAADPSRPVLHFRPPAQWMNDPNGTIFLDGWYHVFYQHNPYGDAWGHMHWGHARSRDLVRWEHLPIALWPSEAQGEEHVFSGAASLLGDGRPILFYTSVGPDRPNEQRAALPLDAQGIKWEKHPANPILTTKLPDGTTLGPGMRDPFPFRVGDRTFLVVGGDTDKESVIPIWEAADPSLWKWDYRGIAWRAPKSEMEFPECPNFFPLDGRFVLLTSPYRPVEYRVGDFDLGSYTFKPVAQGRLDASDQFYATNTATAPTGECILFGWVRGFEAGRGWHGVLALPRVLTIGPDGHPRQRPIAALESRRRKAVDFPAQVDAKGLSTRDVPADPIEVLATLKIGPSSRAVLRLGRGGAAEVAFDGKSLHVAGVEVPLPDSAPSDRIDLRIFLDRTVLEVFANDGTTVATRVVPYRADDQPLLEVRADGGTVTIEQLRVHELAPVWEGNAPLP